MLSGQVSGRSSLAGFGFGGVELEGGSAPNTQHPGFTGAGSAAAHAGGGSDASLGRQAGSGVLAMTHGSQGLSSSQRARVSRLDADPARGMDMLACLAATTACALNGCGGAADAAGSSSQADATQALPAALTQLVPPGVVRTQGAEMLSQAVQAVQAGGGGSGTQAVGAGVGGLASQSQALAAGGCPPISLCGITAGSSRLHAAR